MADRRERGAAVVETALVITLLLTLVMGATETAVLVLDKLAHGSSAEEMHFQYPHLSLAQIYAALSYYHDHQSEFDQKIERELAEVDELATKTGDSPVRKRLRRAGKLP